MKYEKMISIIIPVYNSGRYIEQCITSITRQEQDGCEIILVDDGSNDKSRDICERYAQQYEHITLIRKENGGVSSARNAGMDKARGKYIMFIDSDDYLEPIALESIRSIIAGKEYDFVIYNYYTVHGNEKKAASFLNGLYSPKELFRHYDIYIKHMYYNSIFNKLYKKEILDKNGVTFEPGATMGEDLLFNLRYAESVQEIYIYQCPLYNYRSDNQDSLMHKYYSDFNSIQRKLILSEIGYFRKLDIAWNPNFDRAIYMKIIDACKHYLAADLPRDVKKSRVRETLQMFQDIRQGSLSKEKVLIRTSQLFGTGLLIELYVKLKELEAAVRAGKDQVPGGVKGVEECKG
ncbi:MAG TPA: glycosyltransferase family 2 protein [Clostridiales bacterium]|nr:glycosyltransferase family 2 protein [Clostridiales bacterium]